MEAVTFPEVNVTMTAEGCFDLPVYRYIHRQDGKPDQQFCISAWKPSEKDMEALKAGRPIMLQIYGGQPPVSVYTCDENGMQNEIENGKKDDE